MTLRALALSVALTACRAPEAPSGARPDPTAPAPPASVPDDALRRLTASQYAHALEALFPGVALPTGLVDPDEEIFGFDDNADAQVVSALRVEQYHRAAAAVAAAAIAHPEPWSPCPADGGRHPEGCGERALAGLAEAAFRRPVDDTDLRPYQALFRDALAAEGDFGLALEAAVGAVLEAPEFLYVVEWGAGDPVDGRVRLAPHELATRMALLVWDGPPDRALRDAATSGALATPDGVADALERLLEDPRSARGNDAFVGHWLDLDRVALALPDPGTFPAWDPSFGERLVADQRAFARRATWEGAGTLGALLLGDATPADPELAALHGGERAGFLTHPGWLAAHATETSGSPVQRGKFVLERLLCATMPAPPPGVEAILPPADAEIVTNRQRYEAHTTSPACAGCHDALDGIGFGFEHYDATGAWRTTDHGQPVDATGELATGDLDGVRYDGAVALSEALATSDTVHRCVATQRWRSALGRAEDPVGEDGVLDDLGERFRASGGDFRQLLRDVVATDTFQTRSAR